MEAFFLLQVESERGQMLGSPPAGQTLEHCPGGGCRKPNRPVKGGRKIERQNEVAQWLPEPNPRAVLWGEDAMLSPNGAMGAVCLCRMGPSLQSKMHGQEHG